MTSLYEQQRLIEYVHQQQDGAGASIEKR